MEANLGGFEAESGGDVLAVDGRRDAGGVVKVAADGGGRVGVVGTKVEEAASCGLD